MSKNNYTFVKQTPKFLRELQESQEAAVAGKEAEREIRSRSLEESGHFDEEAPLVVNAHEFDDTVKEVVASKPAAPALNEDEKKKAKLLQNVQKRNKSLLSFEEDE